MSPSGRMQRNEREEGQKTALEYEREAVVDFRKRKHPEHRVYVG